MSQQLINNKHTNETKLKLAKQDGEERKKFAGSPSPATHQQQIHRKHKMKRKKIVKNKANYEKELSSPPATHQQQSQI